MTKDVLSKLRMLLARKGVTLKKVSEITGVSISTLADMKSPDWQRRTVDNLDAIESHFAEIEALAVETAE